AVDADDAAVDRDRVAGLGPRHGLAHRASERGATGIGVLDHHRRRLGELQQQPQRRREVEHVVVPELRPMPLLHPRQPHPPPPPTPAPPPTRWTAAVGCGFSPYLSPGSRGSSRACCAGYPGAAAVGSVSAEPIEPPARSAREEGGVGGSRRGPPTFKRYSLM